MFALAVGCAAWIGVRGAIAMEHMSAARTAVAAIADGSDDPSQSFRSLAAAGADTAEARSLTSDPVWKAASTLPWIGSQLGAVARVIGAADDVCTRAVGPLSDVTADLSPAALSPVDGRVDVARLAEIAPVAASSSAVITQAAADVAAIDRRPLLGVVASAVSESDDALQRAADAVDALSRITRLLPRMLGAEGPRSYLVLFETNAEWRSLGGVVGAVAQIHTQDGRMALTAQASTADFDAIAGEPAGPLADEVTALFGTGPARYIQNATQVPDFAVGAPLAREMWERLRGTRVDGVIALDPVTLSYLLGATGPVTLPTGEQLNADNAASLLLDEVYRRYPDPRDQDAYFQSAAAAVFQALADGHADGHAMAAALRRAGAERRLLMWNADADDQAVLDGTPLQGALPESTPSHGTVGVYLDDGTGSKMDVYLHPQVETAPCSSDVASVHVSLRNDAPDPSTLPAYVTGGGTYGVTPGEALTGVYVYLPVGTRVLDRRTTGETAEPVGIAEGVHDGRPVVKWSVQLAPGQEAELDLAIRVEDASTVDAVMTPVRDPDIVPRTGDCRFAENPTPPW